MHRGDKYMLPKSLDTLRIDINSGKVRKAISVCQSDSVQRTLNFQIVNSGTPVDLSNLLFAEILIQKADGYEADNGCVIDVDSIQYTLRSTDIAALGTNIAQLQLTFADGQVLTTPTFEINVYSKVLNQKVQKSFNEYTALTEQLVMVNELVEAAQSYIQQTEEARDEAITKAEEAVESAKAAAESAEASEQSAKNSAESAKSASDSLENANESAESAKDSADAAEQSAIQAKSSKEDAFNSALNASNSAGAAESSANKAKEYSESANESAQSASNSASEAAESKDKSATSESNALEYAERAEEAYRKMGEEGLVLGEQSNQAYRGDRGKIAYDHSQITGNPHGTTYSDVGADQEGAAAAAYQQAAAYINLQIANLINGAPETLDTLKEIADAMAEHESVVEALQEAIGSKAAEADFEGHTNNTTVHITAQERTLWNGITALTQRVAEIEGKLGYPINPS